MNTNPYSAVASANTVAPAANAVLADSGQLAAGLYDIDMFAAVADTLAVGKGIVIEHRNAANGATLQSYMGCPAGNGAQLNLRGVVVQTNERIRAIVMAGAPAALSQYVASISIRKVK